MTTTKMEYFKQTVCKLLSAMFCVLCFTTCYVGIPEATVARTDGPNAIKELQDFLDEVDRMRPHLGGDDPERQLRALQATLDARNSDGIAVMIPGSQIVLLTDAPTHDEERLGNVIERAVDQKVCINFFLSYSNWTGYWTIASKTGGTVVQSLDRTSIRTFNYSHSANQCAVHYKLQFDHQIKKRSAPSPDNTAKKCKYFSTSLFTTKVSLTVNTTADLMRVTKPDGDETNAQGEKTFHDPTPQSGLYSVCVDNETLTITVEKTENMSAIVKYLTRRENSTVVFLRHTPPPARK